jgi:hypothetical protein
MLSMTQLWYTHDPQKLWTNTGSVTEENATSSASQPPPDAITNHEFRLNYVSKFTSYLKHKKNYISLTIVNRFMQIRIRIVAYSVNYNGHINVLCKKNAAFVYVKAGGIYRFQCALNSIVRTLFDQ